MSETPTTYDCGMTCSCDAVTERANERTELMEEMAAALQDASLALLDAQLSGAIPQHVRGQMTLARLNIRAVLTKYRGEGRDSG